MSIDEQRHALKREIQACNLRLSLLPPFGDEHRDAEFRTELQNQRDEATRALTALDRLSAGIQPR